MKNKEWNESRFRSVLGGEGKNKVHSRQPDFICMKIRWKKCVKPTRTSSTQNPIHRQLVNSLPLSNGNGAQWSGLFKRWTAPSTFWTKDHYQVDRRKRNQMRCIVIYPVDSANHFTDELTGVIPEFPTKQPSITISWKIVWFHLAAADLNKVKIKLSHVQQMTANQQINSFHVKLQLRRAFTHEPKRRKKQEMVQLVMRKFATDVTLILMTGLTLACNGSSHGRNVQLHRLLASASIWCSFQWKGLFVKSPETCRVTYLVTCLAVHMIP